MKNKNIPLDFKNLNIFNYFTIWITIWFLLFINKNIKYNPIIPYISILYPTLYILYIYIKYNKDKLYKEFKIVILSILMHYVPLIYLYIYYKVEIKVTELFIYLIMINLYFIYLRINNLDINKIYSDIYFNNNLL